MKKLQNNFTTPEQSKRLLKLGVPTNSADCYIHISECVKYNFDEKREEIYKKCEYGVIGGSGIFGSEIPALLHLSDGSPEYLPCWSVGRLIEIYLTCALEYHPYDDFYTETPSLHLMAFDKDRLIEEVIEIMSEDEMDFSKLEE